MAATVLTNANLPATIGRFGGVGFMQIAQVDPNSTPPYQQFNPGARGGSSGTTDANSGIWVNLGQIELGSIERTEDSPIEQKNWLGLTVQYIDGLLGYKITPTLLQSDKATIDIAKNTRGLFYEVYVDAGIRNGKRQEYYFPTCRLSQKIKDDRGATVTKIPLDIVVLGLIDASTNTTVGIPPTISAAGSQSGSSALNVSNPQYYASGDATTGGASTKRWNQFQMESNPVIQLGILFET